MTVPPGRTDSSTPASWQLCELAGQLDGEVGRLLAQNRHVVEALRDALLTNHELIGDAILDAIRSAEGCKPGDPVEMIDLREVPSTEY